MKLSRAINSPESHVFWAQIPHTLGSQSTTKSAALGLLGACWVPTEFCWVVVSLCQYRPLTYNQQYRRGSQQSCHSTCGRFTARASTKQICQLLRKGLEIHQQPLLRPVAVSRTLSKQNGGFLSHDSHCGCGCCDML